MKVNKNYVLSHFNDVNVLVDITGKFNGVIRLSSTSADVWQAFPTVKASKKPPGYFAINTTYLMTKP